MTAYEPHVVDKARYTVMQAAEMLGVNRTTIYRWMKQGMIKYIILKINGDARIPATEITRVWREKI